MTDCPNGEMRDLLPELLHDRLAPEVRAAVQAHVDVCAECRAELALLRQLSRTLHGAPVSRSRVDAIVAALPAPAGSSSMQSATVLPFRRRMPAWRAAAALLIVAGGTSLLLVDRGRRAAAPTVATAPAVVAPAPGQVPASVGSPAAPATRVAAATHAAPSAPSAQVAKASEELGLAGSSVSELTDAELARFLAELETLDATPSAEVESTMPVTPVVPPRGTS